MEIREIDAAVITAAVKKLFMDCNYFIGADIMDDYGRADERARKGEFSRWTERA